MKSVTSYHKQNEYAFDFSSIGFSSSTMLSLKIFSVVCFLSQVKGNILGNGDFESGNLSPWTCRSCHCHVTEGVLGN